MARGRRDRRQSKAIGDELRAAVATVVKATALEIDANLRATTPVDTGHARANWVPSVGSAHDGETTGEGAHAAGVAAVVGYQLEDGPVFVSNSAPYVQRLNEGHSKQAPALFIEAAIDKALATMQARYGASSLSLERFQSAVGGQGAANLASAYLPHGLPDSWGDD